MPSPRVDCKCWSSSGTGRGCPGPWLLSFRCTSQVPRVQSHGALSPGAEQTVVETTPDVTRVSRALLPAICFLIEISLPCLKETRQRALNRSVLSRFLTLPWAQAHDTGRSLPLLGSSDTCVPGEVTELSARHFLLSHELSPGGHISRVKSSAQGGSEAIPRAGRLPRPWDGDLLGDRRGYFVCTQHVWSTPRASLPNTPSGQCFLNAENKTQGFKENKLDRNTVIAKLSAQFANYFKIKCVLQSNATVRVRTGRRSDPRITVRCCGVAAGTLPHPLFFAPIFIKKISNLQKSRD